MKRKIVLAITGASGSIYAKLLMDFLKLKENIEVGVVMSDNAKIVWEHELGNDDYKHYDFNFYDKNNFNAPFASGSAKYETMIICPRSIGLIGRIASGVFNNLMRISANFILK